MRIVGCCFACPCGCGLELVVCVSGPVRACVLSAVEICKQASIQGSIKCGGESFSFGKTTTEEFQNSKNQLCAAGAAFRRKPMASGQAWHWEIIVVPDDPPRPPSFPSPAAPPTLQSYVVEWLEDDQHQKWIAECVAVGVLLSLAVMLMWWLCIPAEGSSDGHVRLVDEEAKHSPPEPFEVVLQRTTPGEEIGIAIGADAENHVVVAGILPGTIAEAYGDAIQVLDRILKINGNDVTPETDFFALISPEVMEVRLLLLPADEGDRVNEGELSSHPASSSVEGWLSRCCRALRGRSPTSTALVVMPGSPGGMPPDLFKLVLPPLPGFGAIPSARGPISARTMSAEAAEAVRELKEPIEGLERELRLARAEIAEQAALSKRFDLELGAQRQRVMLDESQLESKEALERQLNERIATCLVRCRRRRRRRRRHLLRSRRPDGPPLGPHHMGAFP